ncbi:MAG: hypothetical protein QOF21_2755, partial [Actinomycetota bacterium]
MTDGRDPGLGVFCAVLVDVSKDLALDRRLCRAWHARGEALLGVVSPHHLACDDLGP